VALARSGKNPTVIGRMKSGWANGDQALHAHIFARYRTESPERRKGPVWMYDAAVRNAESFDPIAHAELRGAVATWLAERGLLE
jgi:hypothetical protein